ncbi:hypothetical protein BLNAU_5104 [Blattamonas nauphoetae]|uniref:Uncharacterized protein n=1 Tax=Blattamonas nauphoetae TaxID=2049346 RepID=A0ABQ9Y819_9EUKA|nr:hypothetical protein BLNAU_5104 [Blattamonas nauphoetae]
MFPTAASSLSHTTKDVPMEAARQPSPSSFLHRIGLRSRRSKGGWILQDSPQSVSTYRVNTADLARHDKGSGISSLLSKPNAEREMSQAILAQLVCNSHHTKMDRVMGLEEANMSDSEPASGCVENDVMDSQENADPPAPAGLAGIEKQTGTADTPSPTSVVPPTRPACPVGPHRTSGEGCGWSLEQEHLVSRFTNRQGDSLSPQRPRDCWSVCVFCAGNEKQIVHTSNLHNTLQLARRSHQETDQRVLCSERPHTLRAESIWLRHNDEISPHTNSQIREKTDKSSHEQLASMENKDKLNWLAENQKEGDTAREQLIGPLRRTMTLLHFSDFQSVCVSSYKSEQTSVSSLLVQTPTNPFTDYTLIPDLLRYHITLLSFPATLTAVPWRRSSPAAVQQPLREQEITLECGDVWQVHQPSDVGGQESVRGFHLASFADGSGSSTDSIPSIGVLISSAGQIVANPTMLSLKHIAQHCPERLQLKLAETGVIPPLVITLNRLPLSFPDTRDFTVHRERSLISL